MSDMSELYIKQINDLRDWFIEELKSFPALELSKTDYSYGVDSLPQNYHEATSRAFNIWLKEKHYELSYNQMCCGFFAAVRHLKLLEIKQV